MKKDLRQKPIIVEYDGEKNEFKSIKAFSEKYDLNYQTVSNWLNERVKPSIDIKIYYKK